MVGLEVSLEARPLCPLTRPVLHCLTRSSVLFSASHPDICISCGSLNVTLEHPLFIGGMCQNCKVQEALTGVALGLGGISSVQELQV